MNYATYVLKVERSKIAKVIRDYKRVVNNGEILNHVLDVKAYEKELDDLNKAIAFLALRTK
jgi:predicted transcriptional regulator